MKKIVPALLVVTFALAACGQAPTPVAVATRTPMPTFTPTPDATATPVLAPTQTPTPEPTATPTPEGTPTATPTNTPIAKPVVVVRSQTANVRGGPSTSFPTIGRVSSGQRYDIVGKNADGSWWQICCVGGQQGWITGELVATEGDVGAVAVATNIPAPPAQPTRPPAPRPQPTPTSPPAPPPTAPPAFAYRVGSTRCFPNGGITYIEGKVLDRGGAGKNGVLVVFSYAPDGPAVAEYVTGTDPGKVGGYTHIIQFDGPREGTWSVWVVEGGRRTSDIATVKTDGAAGEGKCQQANVDFVQN